jgi:colicin import membrane protein
MPLPFLIFNVTWRNPKPEGHRRSYAPPARCRAKRRDAAGTAAGVNQAEPPSLRSGAGGPPKVEPPKAPPKAEPPKAPPKAEPPPKPDIALKEKQAKAERERKEREKQEADKREADKKQQEKRLAEARERQARERQAREADALKAQAERERQTQQRVAAEATHARADADYVRRIQAKIRGNVVVPPDLSGNPEAVFDVVQLPTGEIIDVQLVKSSGARAYDEAVQRAIIKSSPLPRPDAPDLFRRNLTLKFRPLD